MEVPSDDLFDFFKLPYDIQRTILIEELSFANINNFCTAVMKYLGEKSPEALQFEQDFCENVEFWKDKFKYDFPLSFNHIMAPYNPNPHFPFPTPSPPSHMSDYKWWKKMYRVRLGEKRDIQHQLIQLKFIGTRKQDLPIYLNKLVNDLTEYGKYGYDVNGIDFNVQDQYGYTPLMLLATTGNNPDVFLFMTIAKSGNLDLNIRNEDGITALDIALAVEDPATAETILRLDRDFSMGLRVRDEDLLRASILGYSNVVRLLLERDEININSVDSSGKTALSNAVLKNNVDTVDILLDAGADPNIQEFIKGYTAPMLAIERVKFTGNGRILKRLVESGRLDVNLQSKEGATILMMLLKGLKIAMEDPRAFHRMIEFFKGKIFELIRIYSPDPTIQNNEGRTAIDYAERLGLDSIVGALEYLKSRKEESKRKRSIRDEIETGKRRRRNNSKESRG